MSINFYPKPLKTFEEAYTTSMPFLPANAKSSAKNKSTWQLPQHVYSSRWQQTEEALKNTLKYIYDKLGHKCYLLCVKNKEKHMYRIETADLAPSMKEAINSAVINIGSNTEINSKHRQKIKKMAHGNMRLLQCVLKTQAEDKEVSDTNEFLTLLNSVRIPDGVFIMNLTDAVILERHLKEPFPMVTGNKRLEPEFAKTEQIPVFSLSGAKNYNDIPFPNYDDMMIATGQIDPKFDTYETRWEKKVFHKAVFRGGPSGCGYTTETNMRLKLASMQHPLLDVAITGKGRTIDSNAVKFDPRHGLGMMNTGIKPAPKFMTMAEQSRFKYIIHVDGNVNAYRLLTTMMTGSLVIRVDSMYTSWADHMLKAGQHYVLVRPDLSDLIEKLQWCEMHPRTCEKIAKAGLEAARRLLNLTQMKLYVEALFLTAVSSQKFKNTQKRKTRRVLSVSPPPTPPNEFFSAPASFDPSPPPTPPNGFSPALQEVASPKAASPKAASPPPMLEIIDMPPNAKRCPHGYNAVTINGEKKCKKQTRKNKGT